MLRVSLELLSAELRKIEMRVEGHVFQMKQLGETLDGLQMQAEDIKLAIARLEVVTHD